MTLFSRLSAIIVGSVLGSVLGAVISHALAGWAGIPFSWTTSWTTSGAAAWGWTAASAWHCITKGR